MNELETYIKSYFAINNKHLEKLSSLFTIDTISKGDFHTKTGSYKSNLSFVKSGFFRIYSYHGGKEITQWISAKGEFVTDLSCILFENPARWNIQALTDCEVYSISTQQYHKIGEIVPEWNKLEKLFLSKCFLTLEDRVFSFLSLSAEERYQELFSQRRELFNQIPLNYLASMLGMTPETFSRIRRKAI